jgi:flagellar biosynthesis anti-sigma factor FlgM
MDRINFNGSSDVDFTRNSQRINGNNTEANNSAKPSEAKTSEASDKVSVSDRASTVNRLVDQGLSLPDIRQNVVDRVRAAVQTGNFNPPAGEIAEAIINEELG